MTVSLELDVNSVKMNQISTSEVIYITIIYIYVRPKADG